MAMTADDETEYFVCSDKINFDHNNQLNQGVLVAKICDTRLH